MKVLRRRAGVGDLQIAQRGKLQEALQASAGVFGALPLVAVRQQQRQRAGLLPFLLGAGYELVHDHLGAVGEVSELRLPQHESFGISDAVAVLESQDRELGQQAVVDAEDSLLGVETRQWSVGFAGSHFVEDRVSLAEGPASAVLSAEAYRSALEDQGAEDQRFGLGPVDAVLLEALASLGQLPSQFGVDLESRRRALQPLDDPLQGGPLDAGMGARPGLALDRLEVGQGGRGSGLGPAELVLHLAQTLAVIFEGFLRRGQIQISASHQLLGVELAHRAVTLDRRVQDRIGVGRVIRLGVSPAAVADHVHHDVALERLTKGQRVVDHAHHILRLIAVDVENRRAHHLGHVGRVLRRPRIAGASRETDLVVDHDVHGAARPVALQQREIQRLRHDPLPGERGVSVNQHGQHALPVLVGDAVLVCAGNALDHRVHRLEVARVGSQEQLQLAPVRRDVGARGAQVVLDVARAVGALGIDALELAEDLTVWLPDNLGQHVETAAVCHAEHDFLNAAGCRLGQQTVQQRNQRFRAFQREALVPDVARVQERLEGLCGVELLEDLDLYVAGQRRPGVGMLHPLLQPVPRGGIRDVHVLHADVPAVRALQRVQDLPQRERALLAAEPCGDEAAIEVPGAQPVGRKIELLDRHRQVAQGIQVGPEMTPNPVSPHQLHHAGLLGDGLDVGCAGQHRRVGVAGPANRLLGQAQLREDALVEASPTRHQVLDGRQKPAGLAALNDPVVIGAGQRHHLGQAELGDHLGCHPGVLRRVPDATGADNGALALHQARHRHLRAERARIGQGHRGVLEVLDAELVLTRARQHVVVRREKRREVEGTGVLDVRHQKEPLTLALDVDGQAQVDLVERDPVRPAADLLVAHVHARVPLQPTQRRPCDEMRERDLGPGRDRLMLVHDAAVLVQDLDRYGSDRAGRRNAQTGLHVLDDLFRDPAERFGAGRSRLHLGCRTRSDGTGGAHLTARSRTVILEELLPCLADGCRILEVTRV